MTHQDDPLEQEKELENIRNEVLRKIGRNVVIFQQMELMLKNILPLANISGSASELQSNFDNKKASLHKKTMGQLVKESLTLYTGPSESDEGPEEPKEIWLSSRFRYQCDDIHREQLEKALKSIVDERNELIHHLFPRWKINSIESCKQIEQYLDQQREKIAPELERLQGSIKDMKEFFEFVSSNEGVKQFSLLPLRQSPLVAWLWEIAEKWARPDGWAILSRAEQIIHEHAQEELHNLKKRYGFKSLKAAILATEYFDISEEATNKGGVRVLYRIKPDLVLDDETITLKVNPDINTP